MLKIISVSGSLLQITKLWVNMNSAIHKCRAVIPKAVMGETLAVFSLAVVGCKKGLKTILYALIGRVMEE